MTSQKLQELVEEVIAQYLPDWGLSVDSLPSHEPRRDPVIWYVSLLDCSRRKISIQLIVPPDRDDEPTKREIYEQLKAYLRRQETKAKGFWIKTESDD